MWAQGPSADKREMSAIQRVKTLPVSSLDRDLPKVTLEFFLRYEGEGAPIKWKVNDCGEQTQRAAVAHGRDSAMCVEAYIGLSDGRTATVLVSVDAQERPGGCSNYLWCEGHLPGRDDSPIGSLERFTRGVASSPTQRAQRFARSRAGVADPHA